MVLSFIKEDSLAGFLTGHAALELHPYNLEIAEDQICHLFQEDLESQSTTLCERVAVSLTRHQHFNKPFLTLTEIEDENSRLVLRCMPPTR